MRREEIREWRRNLCTITGHATTMLLHGNSQVGFPKAGESGQASYAAHVSAIHFSPDHRWRAEIVALHDIMLTRMESKCSVSSDTEAT